MEPGRGEESAPQQLRKPKYTKLTQQQLPACQPILDPTWVIFIFLSISVVFIPIGGVCYAYGLKAKEVMYRYDHMLPDVNQHCKPANMTLQAIQKKIWESDVSMDGKNKTCLLRVKLLGKWQSPIFVYYQLEGFYQNHRRYHKSRSDAQLAHDRNADLKVCKPKQTYKDRTILPCGLIAWSYFNDTYEVTNSTSKAGNLSLVIDGKHIAPKADVKERFANVNASNFYPDNLTDRGGGNITTTLKEDERFIIWMRTAALPRFRKLWGRINLRNNEETEDTLVTVNITNQYNSFEFDGTKSLVFATTTWLGGRSRFLGLGYLITGGTSLLMATVYALLYVAKRPSLEDGSGILAS